MCVQCHDINNVFRFRIPHPLGEKTQQKIKFIEGKLKRQAVHFTCTYHISVFDKLIWRTIGPKSFLFGTAQFSLKARVAQLIMIILSLTPLTLYHIFHIA